MPNYRIVFLSESGASMRELSAYCQSDKHARVLAHAMKQREYKRLEVWRDDDLIYARPWSPLAAARIDAAALEAGVEMLPERRAV